MVTAQTFLFREFSHKTQPFIQAFYAIGAVIAPSTCIVGINGLLIDNYSWELLYLVTIPLGLLSLMILSFVDESKFKNIQVRKFDFIRLMLFILFIFPTIYVLYQGNRYNWFYESHIVILTVFSVISLISFILWQIFKHDSLVETKIFKTNLFTFGVVVSLVAGAALFGSGSVFTSFSIKVLGLTLSESGLIFFYSGFMFLLTVFFTAFLVQILSLPPFATIAFGLLGFSFSMYLLSPMLLRGGSMGLLFLSLIAINSLPKDLVSYGIGVFNTTRQLGGTISIGVLSALISQINAQNYNILSSNIIENSTNVTDWLNGYASKLSVNVLDESTAMTLLSKTLNEQVMTVSYSNAFLYLIALIVTAIPCILITKKLLAKFNPEN